MSREAPPYIRKTRDGILLFIHVQPRASRNKIAGIHGKRLKITVQAPPTDGRANKGVQMLLSKRLRVPKSRVILKSGAASREKTFLVIGLCLSELLSRIED